jgi:hypothetical protein
VSILRFIPTLFFEDHLIIFICRLISVMITYSPLRRESSAAFNWEISLLNPSNAAK